jgi:hypothetical protein
VSSLRSRSRPQSAVAPISWTGWFGSAGPSRWCDVFEFRRSTRHAQPMAEGVPHRGGDPPRNALRCEGTESNPWNPENPPYTQLFSPDGAARVPNGSCSLGCACGEKGVPTRMRTCRPPAPGGVCTCRPSEADSSCDCLSMPIRLSGLCDDADAKIRKCSRVSHC